MSSLPAPAFIEAEPDPYSALLHSVMAAEIREMRERLEAMAEALAGDLDVASRHLGQLQGFDYVIQHADECINLLERIAAGENALEAIGHIRLAAVQDRIRAAIEAL